MSELILVTGTSSGIGLTTALACAEAGHRVIATMRNLQRREELDAQMARLKADIAVEQLDVTAPDAEGKVRELILKYGPVYALVNNAGIAVGGAFEEQTEEDIRSQFETNVFGMMAVTRAVIPSMRSARRGRIINMSSMSGRIGLPGVSTYAATKHAIEGWSEALRWELEAFGIDVVLVEPGTFRTSIFFENQHQASGRSADGPYRDFSNNLEAMIMAEAAKAPPPDAVARAVVRLIAANRPSFRTVVGRDAQALVTLRRVIPDRVFATGVRRVVSRLRSRS